MGRGRGAAEHDEDSKRVAEDDPKAVLDRKRRVTDDSDDEDEVEETLIEKAPEQIAQEEEAAWQAYHYLGWQHYVIYPLFAICTVNLCLTLWQYHRTHSSEQPVDYIPRNLRHGGWDGDKEGKRYAGAVMGLIASCFSFVLAPGVAKFKFMFLLMFLGAFFDFWAFGDDLFQLNRAQDMPICENGVPDIHFNKYICDFDRFRATVIFDMLCGFFSFIAACFILYQAITGVVTKRRVFNDQTKAWEKIVLGPNDEYWRAFPNRFKKQRPLFNLMMVFCAFLNVTLLTLSVTQTTLDIYQATNQKEPTANLGVATPVDIFILETQEGIPGGLGTGGWPKGNYWVRLVANIISLVTVAFLIQWRRDDRKQQLIVILCGLVGSVFYGWAFCRDYGTWADATENCDYTKQVGMVCRRMPYTTLVVFDGLCAASLFIFFAVALFQWFKQAVNRRGRAYGWWCFGEWAHLKSLEENA